MDVRVPLTSPNRKRCRFGTCRASPASALYARGPPRKRSTAAPSDSGGGLVMLPPAASAAARGFPLLIRRSTSRRSGRHSFGSRTPAIAPGTPSGRDTPDAHPSFQRRWYSVIEKLVRAVLPHPDRPQHDERCDPACLRTHLHGKPQGVPLRLPLPGSDLRSHDVETTLLVGHRPKDAVAKDRVQGLSHRTH